MASRDHGRSWTVGKPATASEMKNAKAALLGEGSIMLNIRNDHEGYWAVVVTKDLGQTWRTMRPVATLSIGIPTEVCCGFDYEHNGRAATHTVVLRTPIRNRGRTHHTVQVHFDDGLDLAGLASLVAG